MTGDRKRKAREAAGWHEGRLQELLGLTDEENRLIELQVSVSQALRRMRERNGMSQARHARKLKTSQPRVAKMEAPVCEGTLDLLFRALFAAGGGMGDLEGLSQGVRTDAAEMRRPAQAMRRGKSARRRLPRMRLGRGPS